MQSGFARGDFPNDSQNSIVGLATDVMNKLLISADSEGKIKFWILEKAKLESETDIGEGVLQLIVNRDSGLIAVSCDDLVVRILDISFKKIVRQFGGHSFSISDMVSPFIQFEAILP